MNQPSAKKIPPLDLILLLILGLCFIVWQTSQAAYWAGHSINMLESKSSLEFFRSLRQNPLAAPAGFYEYPPLSYWVGTIFYLLSAPDLQITYLSFIVFVLVLIFPLYALGFLWGGRPLGWGLVILTLGNYWTLIWTRIYNLNFAEMAVFTLVFYLLLRTREFSDKSASLWLGWGLGLGLLTKYVLIFVLPPLLWIFLVLLKRELPNLRRYGENLRLMLGGLAVVLVLILGTALGRITLFQNYFLIFQLLGLGLGIWFSRSWSKSEEDFTPLGNFLRALVVALMTALPWYLATLNRQLGKTGEQFLSSSHSHGWTASLHFFLQTAEGIYPLAWLLLGAGLLYCLSRIKSLKAQLLLITLGSALLFNAWLIPERFGFHYFLTLEPLIVLLSLCWLEITPGWSKALMLLLSCFWAVINLSAGLETPHPGTFRQWCREAVIRQYKPVFALGDIIPKGMYFRDLEPQTVRELIHALPPRPGEIVFFNLNPRLLAEAWLDKLDIREFRSEPPYLEREKLDHWENAFRGRNNGFLLLASRDDMEKQSWEQKIRNKGIRLSLLKNYPEGDSQITLFGWTKP